jgi:ribosomal-protein-alanine N-acetyltransferase
MDTSKIIPARVVKMRRGDIEEALEIQTEAGLEGWKYDDFISEIQRNDSFILVVKIKTQIVGFCVARLIKHYLYKSSECEIYNIAIKENFQNRGLGSYLLNWLIGLLKEYNTESIWLEVRNSNWRAVSFYKKNDFRPIYERKNFYSHPVENAIVMKRNLLSNPSD